jgi:flagellar basal-body rod protein FlgG
VAVQSTSQIVSQGAMQTTNNGLDLALDGDGYFQVEMPGGQLGYTAPATSRCRPKGRS